MTAGRKPTPTWLKVIAGNPGKRPLNANEPIPSGGIGPPPPNFSEAERTVWLEMTNAAPAGLLTQLERPSLEMYCASKVRYDFCKAKCEQYGTVVKTPTGAWTYSPYYTQMRAEEKTCKGLLIEFGYTPSSRSRVSIAAKRKGQAETPFDDLKELGD